MGNFDNVRADYAFAQRNGYTGDLCEYVVYRLTLVNMMRARCDLPALTLGAVFAYCGLISE